MIQFFLKGGLLMWPILLCSVIAVTITLERLFYFRKSRVNVSLFLAQIKTFLSQNKVKEAEGFVKKFQGPVAHIIAVGIKNRHQSHLPQKMDEMMSQAGSEELRKLEKHLRTLGIIAHISPLLGLLGTVTGMIQAFMKIQGLGGRVDASVLAGGIWAALITTAAGLMVAIPTMVVYHYFEGKVDEFATQMKHAVQSLFDWLGVGSDSQKKSRYPVKEDVEYGV
jgi:biopolymer transport protein ExbB